jgi:hypothetical protein
MNRQREGRGEVKAHTRVLFEELPHRLGLVRRQVIQDNVDLFKSSTARVHSTQVSAREKLVNLFVGG